MKKREERVFVIIKDGFQGKVEQIKKIYENKGLTFIHELEKKFERNVIERVYSHLSEKSFFGEVIDYMTSSKLTILFFYGDNAVKIAKEITGSTDPAIAKEGTVRALVNPDDSKKIPKNIQNNVVHCSENAKEHDMELWQLFTEPEVALGRIPKY